MAAIGILKSKTAIMEREGIFKVFSVKDGLHHYSVEEIPGYCGFGRDYVVMVDRRRLAAERFRSAQLAKAWLILYLHRLYNYQTELELLRGRDGQAG